MLKKIATSQLRLGMHVHALEGSWLEHPFWKSKFMLDAPADLKRLRESGVKECWINATLGRDVDQAQGVSLASAPIKEAAPSRGVHARAASTTTLATAAKAPESRKTLTEELGQAAAICKQGRQAVTAMFNEARMGRAIDAESCQPLVEMVSQSVLRNPGALVSLARIKTRDDYTYMHSLAVCAMMISLSRQLGMDDDATRSAGMAGLLHDIGKAVIPLNLLNKPGKLSTDEFDIMRTHPARGHALLLEGQGACPEALDVCLHHHERIDGKGYPFGLVSADLTSLARMGAVCDVYDAITSHRPYKAGWNPAESIAQMATWKGHFDLSIFGAFVRCLGIYPTGSLVRLASGRLAVVVEQNLQHLTMPLIKVFYSTRSMMPITPQWLDLARQEHECIVSCESPAAWGFAHLDEHWLPVDVHKRSR